MPIMSEEEKETPLCNRFTLARAESSEINGRTAEKDHCWNLSVGGGASASALWCDFGARVCVINCEAIRNNGIYYWFLCKTMQVVLSLALVYCVYFSLLSESCERARVIYISCVGLLWNYRETGANVLFRRLLPHSSFCFISTACARAPTALDSRQWRPAERKLGAPKSSHPLICTRNENCFKNYNHII